MNLVEDNQGVLQEKPFAQNVNNNAINDSKDHQNQQKSEKLFWSAYLQGMVRFLKLKLNSQNPSTAIGGDNSELK